MNEFFEVLVRHDVVECPECGAVGGEVGSPCPNAPYGCEGTMQAGVVETTVNVADDNIDGIEEQPEVVRVVGEVETTDPSSATTEAESSSDSEPTPVVDGHAVAQAITDVLAVEAVPAAELAERIGVDVAVVSQVLDEFRFADGEIEHVGSGQGGGWLPPEPDPEPRPRRVPLAELAPELQLQAIDRMYDAIAISEDQRDRLKERALAQLDDGEPPAEE